MATTKAKARIGPADLGIDLTNPTDAAVFRWLVACQLFGARISKGIGPTAADIFVRELASGWQL
jgi:hypothetical protein